MADLDENIRLNENVHVKKNQSIQNNIAYAAGLFQEDVTTRTLLESLGQGVVIVDNTGTILLTNVRAEQMFGYKSADLIGQHHDLLLPKRYHEIHQKHMALYFKGPKIRPMGQGLALVGTRSDGSEFPMEISLSYVKTRSSLLVITLISDITPRIEIEKALKDRMEELSQANSALESFSYSVSHDLRTPLAIMIGFSQILKEDYSDKLDEEGQMYLNRIIHSANNMSQLISDVLNLSRIAKQEVVVQDCNLSDMARLIMDDLRATEPSRNVDIVIHDELKAKGDPKLLKIALTNLLSNAWKFTGKTKSPRIEFGVTIKNKEKTFFIKDNGAGFKTDNEKIFKPFHRMHSESEFPGTGIGLAIVDRVVLRHNGKIWAESTPGEGSVFYFAFPGSA
jgi:PAS domain S-box-containing protein